MLLYWILGIMVLQQMNSLEATKFKGDACLSKGSRGICKEWGECPVIKTLIEGGEYKKSEVVSCGLGIKEELICCPVIDNGHQEGEDGSTVQNTNRFEGSNSSPKPNATNERPAVRACQRLEKGLIASNVSMDPDVKRGDFPHVVVIGYKRFDADDKNPYKMICSGSLIDKRFVLTAAHCLQGDDVPVVVRLGVVNFSDPEEMSTAVEMKIKKIYMHPQYTSSLVYNDIAILELEHEVETNEYIYPICLYTNEEDPDTNTQLWVSGWRNFNKYFENPYILRKVPMYTWPLEKCNEIYKEYGLTRRIKEGIKGTQLCAQNKEQEISDVCVRESGGPLNLIKDETYRNYRLVGIVSAGFDCYARMPGLYTKVAAFLDFIESIVWPNGGRLIK
ncbi:hayan isoform 2-T4 [Cochliomyia hominivorax]